MLFDEVTSALDPELIKEVLDVHARARRRGDDDGGRHARDRASRARSRTDVVFMDEGVIVEEGPVRRVIDAPREERTKQFLGLVLEH